MEGKACNGSLDQTLKLQITRIIENKPQWFFPCNDLDIWKWYVSMLNTLIFTIVNQMFLKIIAIITIVAIVDVCCWRRLIVDCVCCWNKHQQLPPPS
jgi:hypothetical protein